MRSFPLPGEQTEFVDALKLRYPHYVPFYGTWLLQVAYWWGFYLGLHTLRETSGINCPEFFILQEEREAYIDGQVQGAQFAQLSLFP